MKNQRFFIDVFICLTNIGAKTLSASAQSSQVEKKGMVIDMKRSVGIGNQDFAKIITNNIFYVDKTTLSKYSFSFSFRTPLSFKKSFFIYKSERI